MTQTLGQDPSNGGVVGPSNEPGELPIVYHDITSTNPSFSLTYGAANCDVLLVGGGGNGTGKNAGFGSGGGAGGVLLTPNHPLPASAFPVTVGAGASGIRPNNHGNDGSDTVIGASSPLTGGFGAGGQRGAPTGSGGGGGGPSGPQGNNGGSSSNPGYAGGGGGAGGAGIGPPTGQGGDGAPVVPLFGSYPQPYYPSSTFQSTFGGGGVGGGNGVNNPFGFRPPGGGGHGAPNEGGGEGGAGQAGYGAGGGGDGNTGGTLGGAGGSGKVIIKEPSGGFLAVGVWSLKAQYTYLIQSKWPT